MVAIPLVPPPGDLKLRVALSTQGSGARGTIWQPRDGEVIFTVTSIKGGALEPMNIVACFRWHGNEGVPGWMASPLPLRIIEIGQGAITFGARVPNLPNAPSEWWTRVRGGAGEEEYAGLWIVPIADFRVVATTAADWRMLDVVLPVGVTSVEFSNCVAILGVVIAWYVLYVFGKLRGVPGNDPLLKLISTRSGYASLSQLQILMWSFVVGASAIYVMALSGDLIDISNGTLLLLGITGIAALGSKLQSHLDDQARTAVAPDAVPASTPVQPAIPIVPGAVTDLSVAPGFVPTQAELRLSWAVPGGGGPPSRYTVQYRTSGAPAGAWVTASSAVSEPRFTIVGLTGGTKYDVRVLAANAGGNGTFSDVLEGVTTAPAIPVPAGAPAPIANLAVFGEGTDGTVLTLVWDVVPGATAYQGRYRLHDGDDLWRNIGSVAADRMRIQRLEPNRFYDVQIAAANTHGQGPWSAIGNARTGPRTPLWSDLVVTPGSSSSVDMPRVQMLFFTVITAIFVALKVHTSNLIPEIPQGFLLLMGISNGVYLTAKSIPG